MDHKPQPQTCGSDITLLNSLNYFFGQFKADNSTPAQKMLPPPDDHVLSQSSFTRLQDLTTSSFNDYRPVALSPIAMKCFEWLVMQHIKSVLSPSLDPYQFAHQAHQSTEDAISTALFSALTHLGTKASYVRMLFSDFSSAFNTITPQQLIQSLNCLGLNTSLCNLFLDFLTGRPQTVWASSNASSTIIPNTGARQGCVLSPRLFTLLTHDCTPTHNSNLFVKSVDDTTVVELINNDESNYTDEVSQLAVWCRDNNLSVVNFQRAATQHPSLTINSAAVDRVSSTKFLVVPLTKDFSWSSNIAGQKSPVAPPLPL